MLIGTNVHECRSLLALQKLLACPLRGRFRVVWRQQGLIKGATRNFAWLRYGYAPNGKDCDACHDPTIFLEDGVVNSRPNQPLLKPSIVRQPE